MKAKDWDIIAKDYHKEVISPFQRGVKNPLFKELNKLPNRKDKIIADIGCGRGEILDILASDFKKVYAMDFSPMMIKIAKEIATKKNVDYSVRDMRYLSIYNNKFDVVVSVNSVLMPDIIDVKKALRSVNQTLKKEGVFYGIFPSMESILYQGFLILDLQIHEKKDMKKAMRATKVLLERKKYNFVTGIYNDNGQSQKFYYDFELKIRLRDAGFKDIKISKVLYPWSKEVSDYVNFPGKPKMWDWFVVARK